MIAFMSFHRNWGSKRKKKLRSTLTINENELRVLLFHCEKVQIRLVKWSKIQSFPWCVGPNYG